MCCGGGAAEVVVEAPPLARSESRGTQPSESTQVVMQGLWDTSAVQTSLPVQAALFAPTREPALKEWEFSTEIITWHERLGAGSFGAVHRVTLEPARNKFLHSDSKGTCSTLELAGDARRAGLRLELEMAAKKFSQPQLRGAPKYGRDEPAILLRLRWFGWHCRITTTPLQHDNIVKLHGVCIRTSENL